MFGQVLAEVYVRVNTIARYSSPPLSAFPFDPVRHVCEKYGRRGQYRKATLIERHGPDNRRARSISCDRELSATQGAERSAVRDLFLDLSIVARNKVCGS